MGAYPDRIKIGFLHTFPLSVTMVNRLAARHLPGVQAVHIMDELLKLNNLAAPVGTTPEENIARYVAYTKDLERAGCRAVFSCCSLMPQAVAEAKREAGIPVYQLDAPLFFDAVHLGGRIGLISANPRAVPHAERALAAAAQRTGREFYLTTICDEKAYAAMGQANLALHDSLLFGDLTELSSCVDCVLAAQINFGILEEEIEKLKLNCPVLCAGSRLFARLKQALDSGGISDWEMVPVYR